MAAKIRQHQGEVLSICGDEIIGAFTDKENSAPIEVVRCVLTMSTLLNFVVNKRIRSFNQA